MVSFHGVETLLTAPSGVGRPCLIVSALVLSSSVEQKTWRRESEKLSVKLRKSVTKSKYLFDDTEELENVVHKDICRICSIFADQNSLIDRQT